MKIEFNTYNTNHRFNAYQKRNLTFGNLEIGKSFESSYGRRKGFFESIVGFVSKIFAPAEKEKTASKSVVISKTRDLTATTELEHEKLITDLERKFTKGKEFYLPSYGTSFSPKILKEIYPRTYYNSYKEELKRMCDIYLENTSKVDTSSGDFHELTRNYFSNAAKSLKEIFNIGAETRLLERIPKLGIIPKALRINDQIRLSKCVKHDYDDVTNSYVKEGYMPLINKYNRQFDVIEDFVRKHSFKSFVHKSYTNKYLNKLKEARANRIELSSKLLENYSKSGSNLCNMTKNITKSGVFDLVKKTVISFVSFV